MFCNSFTIVCNSFFVLLAVSRILKLVALHNCFLFNFTKIVDSDSLQVFDFVRSE